MTILEGSDSGLLELRARSLGKLYWLPTVKIITCLALTPIVDRSRIKDLEQKRTQKAFHKPF